jgi:hypothetical protein
LIAWPKITSAGEASTPSIREQMFSVPLIRMLPVVGCSSQVMCRATGLVVGLSTSNVAERAPVRAGVAQIGCGQATIRRRFRE